MKDYITFPILLCDKNVVETEYFPCYIVSRGLKKYELQRGGDVDFNSLQTAIKDLILRNTKKGNLDDIKGSWVKPFLSVREPDVCLASRNLLFSFPGCISVDEIGNRFFLSDVNHHRIIVFNGDGKILDAVSSLV
ncbi:hypothetical protein M569_07061 [Genlisea aurea]|uniref:Uncharacterized protein n=1 Tax=Genlisea aurea TaxID=192259 RepID=S8CKJ1_9LAMI|nr:hypothetical protein M569_07061 [Genlisea aurea]